MCFRFVRNFLNGTSQAKAFADADEPGRGCDAVCQMNRFAASRCSSSPTGSALGDVIAADINPVGANLFAKRPVNPEHPLRLTQRFHGQIRSHG